MARRSTDLSQGEGPLLAVLADGRDQEDFDVLFPALGEHGIRTVRCDPREITTEVRAGRLAFGVNGRPLEPALVLGWALEEVRDPAMVMLDLFALAGVPVLNDAMTLYRAQHKLLNAARLASGGALGYPIIAGHDPATLRQWTREEGTRAVVKPMRGYGGRGVRTIDGEDELRDWWSGRADEEEPFFAMPWIENPRRDIRVYTVNHHPVFAMYRYAPEGSFVTNVKAGGSIAMCPLTSELIDIAARASRAAGTPIGGIDVAEDRAADELVVYEANSCPSLEPAVLGEVADFLAAAARDPRGALERWEPDRVFTQQDDSPELFHPSKRHLLRQRA